MSTAASTHSLCARIYNTVASPLFTDVIRNRFHASTERLSVAGSARPRGEGAMTP